MTEFSKTKVLVDTVGDENTFYNYYFDRVACLTV